MSAIWATIKQTALATLGDGVPHERQVLEYFRLPEGETLVVEANADFALAGSELGDKAITGNLYLTTSYLCFRSSDRSTAVFIMPLFAIKKVERLGGPIRLFKIVVTTWHKMRITIHFLGHGNHIQHFCDMFKKGLKEQQSNMKVLSPFLSGCHSEYMMRNAAREKELPPPAANTYAEYLVNEAKLEKEMIPPAAGMGMEFYFPGDARKLKDKSKMRLWLDYMEKNGRNLTIVRFPLFHKLVRVGLPNALRGEIWEITSGAMLSRWAHPGEYEKLQEANAGKSSISLEEIEKDLNRSLPEFPAYQDENIGIGALRRVLTTYSWKNPELGYCQAMNIVVAALLIYATEEQSFWLLDTLCSEMLPGYYSTTMYGTLLDQRVFESLVAQTMPVLWAHLQKTDLQLSLVSLPWFLSLYINSMPLVLAFRVLDCFFLEGPRVLFQVGLGILKINGDRLLAVTDDGSFIEVLKEYFLTLEDPAYPESSDPRTRVITKFQVLMVVAFKEFSNISHDMVMSERRKHKNSTLDSIEQFAKRTQLRSLSDTGRLSKEELSNLYDRFHLSIYKQRVGFGGAADMRMDYASFRVFMAGIAKWAQEPESEHAFMHQIFERWDTSFEGSLSLQNVIQGVAELRTDETTPMEMISWFFDLFNVKGEGILRRDDLLKVTESLLWLTRYRTDDSTLRAMSNFLHRCFEFGEQDEKTELISLPESEEVQADDMYVTLATFRMVVLADQALEEFFTRFPSTLQITEIKETAASANALRGLMDAVVADTQKLALEIRRNVKDFDEEIGNQNDGGEEENDKDVLRNDLLVREWLNSN